MAIITREEIRSRKALRTKTSDVEGFGAVKYRELSLGESKKIALLQDKGHDAAIYVTTRGMLNTDGSQMFPDVTLKDDGTLDMKPEDAADLADMGSSIIANIVDLILILSGVKKEQPGPKP